LVPAVTPVVAVQSTNGAIGGNEYQASLTLPSTEVTSLWGIHWFAHHSATLPTQAPYASGTAGQITAAINVLTDLTATFTPHALIGKTLVVFSPNRPSSPSWDYEGMILYVTILDNTATTLTFDALPQNLTRTQPTATDARTCKYYIVSAGAGFFNLIDYVSPYQLTTSTAVGSNTAGSKDRSFTFASPNAPIYVWAALVNAIGEGPVTATPGTASY